MKAHFLSKALQFNWKQGCWILSQEKKDGSIAEQIKIKLIHEKGTL